MNRDKDNEAVMCAALDSLLKLTRHIDASYTGKEHEYQTNLGIFTEAHARIVGLRKAIQDLREDAYYTYTNEEGQEITVYVIDDCGMMKDQEGNPWHKVLCKPIGLNNSPLMALDYNKLVKELR